jgi:hypothetical protein
LTCHPAKTLAGLVIILIALTAGLGKWQQMRMNIVSMQDRQGIFLLLSMDIPKAGIIEEKTMKKATANLQKPKIFFLFL